MKNAFRRIVSVGAGLILLTVAVSFAQDWPQWRGPGRDGKAGGFTAPETWPQELTPKWKVPVGAGDATPALVGDKLYVFTRQGEEEVTQCLNAENGAQIWEDRHTAMAVTGPAQRHPGPRSSPAVANGKVVTLGVGGVVSCLDAATGKALWRKDPFEGADSKVPKFFTAMSPVIVDGLCVAQLGGPGAGAVIAFDLVSGEEKWRWGGEGPEYASPALLTADGTTQIVTLTEKSVVGIALADGKLLWQLPFQPEGRAYNAATPIVNGQTVIYTGSGRGAKAVKIEKKGDGFVAGEIWSNPEVAPQYNTPVLKDGFLFGLSDKGNLYCVNAKTGATAWLDTAALGKGGFGAIVDAGSVLMLLPSSGEMVVFKPNEKQYEEVARIKAAGTPTYAHPVISGNRIFIKDQDSLAMATIP